MERSVVTRLMLNPAGFIGGLKAASGASRGFMSEFDQAAQKNTKGFHQLAQGAAIGGVAILGALGMAAKAVMNFDRAMSGVASNGAEFTGNMDALREEALQAGAATQFSATQAADAENELAKAGVSVKDILGGGLQGALNLAAAGQLDVGDAAEIAATAMSQFGLEGSKVPHIADLLSATANKAQGSVQDVGMALKQGGLVASQFGLSIEETTGSLAAFAKAGLIGSDAGTSLKTMLLALANPSKESAALMEKLGIHAYDATGKFVGLAGLAGNLRQALAGLTQQQRDQALAQIFGADATRAANVLYRNGAEGIKKWTSEVDDAGNAARTAATKTDNLAGDLERLGGSFETALIKQGSAASGVLRVLAQAATNSVDGFSGMPGAVQGTITVLALVTGSALAAGGAYGILAPKVRAASAALIGMGPAGKVANTALMGVGKYGSVALGVFAGLEIVGAVGDQFAAAAPDVDRLARSLEKYASSGKATGEMTRIFEADLGKLKSAIEIQRAALEHPTAAKVGSFISAPLDHWLEDSNNNLIKKLQATDAALAQMVSSGHAQQAANAVRQMGVASNEVAGILPKYSGALGDAKDKTADAANGFATTAGQARVMATGLAAAAHEAGSLSTVLEGLNGVNIGTAEAQIRYQTGLNSLTGALKEHKGAWNGVSDAALHNKQIVIDQIKVASDLLGKQYEQVTASQGEAAAATWASHAHAGMRTSMVNAAVAAGISRKAADDLVSSLFKIPASTPAKVSAPGAKEAKGDVASFGHELFRLPPSMGPKVSAPGAVQATREVNNFRSSVNAIEHGASTTITAHASAGAAEHALNYTARDRTTTVHVRTVGSANALEHRWGGIDYHAAGGRIQAHTVSSPTVLYGERETGGEAFVPRRGDPARSKAILAEAASWYGGMVSFAGGGVRWSGGAGTGGGDTIINFAPTFTGPVGSQMQLDNWLAGGIDKLKRRGRI